MPKVVDHDLYKNELALRGAGFLTNQGFAQISMRDLAKALEVSTGTLYHYFPTKEDYLAHMFRVVSDASLAEIEAGLCAEKDPVARIRSFFDIIAGQCEQTRNQFLLTYDVFRSSLPKKTLAVWRRRLRKHLVNLVGISNDYAELVLTYITGFIYLRAVSGQGDTAGFEKIRLIIEKELTNEKSDDI